MAAVSAGGVIPRVSGRSSSWHRGGKPGTLARMTARALSSTTSPASPVYPLFPPRRRPARFAMYDRHTWKEIAHLLANLPIGVAGFVYVVVTLAAGGGLAVTVVGLPLLACALIGARQIGKVERARARRLLGVRIDEPSPMPRQRRARFLQLAVVEPEGSGRLAHDAVLVHAAALGRDDVRVTLVGLFVLWPVLPLHRAAR